jgi:hypothetical protein
VLTRFGKGKFCSVAAICRFDEGRWSPSVGNFYCANARNCVDPPISRFSGVNKTVGGASKTVDRANQTIAGANQTVDQANQPIDRVNQTIDGAQKTIDRAKETIDGTNGIVSRAKISSMAESEHAFRKRSRPRRACKPP